MDSILEIRQREGDGHLVALRIDKDAYHSTAYFPSREEVDKALKEGHVFLLSGKEAAKVRLESVIVHRNL